MADYVRISDGSTEPVSFFEVQEHLRLDDETDEATVNLYIQAARESFEYLSNYIITTSQTWEVYYDYWHNFRIAKAPVLGITSVEYYDSDDALQTFSAANYRTYLVGKENVIDLKSSVAKPALSNRKGKIKVTFTAGHSTISTVPAIAKQAVMFLVGHYYENRQQVVVMPGVSSQNIPEGFRSLVSRLRLWR